MKNKNNDDEDNIHHRYFKWSNNNVVNVESVGNKYNYNDDDNDNHIYQIQH